MKKFLIVLVIVILSFVLLVATVGCTKNIPSITDVNRFADMQKTADKIVVHGGYEPTPIDYTITDKAEIEEIMDTVFSTTLRKEPAGSIVPPVDDIVIKIYQGEKIFELNVFYIFENGRIYLLSSALRDKIAKIL